MNIAKNTGSKLFKTGRVRTISIWMEETEEEKWTIGYHQHHHHHTTNHEPTHTCIVQ